MFTSIKDFERAWQQESDSVLKLMNELTDASLQQPVTNDHRNLGRVAWHVVTTITEMIPLTGLQVEGPHHESPVPATADEIRRAFQTASGSLLKQITANWTDETLNQEDEMYGSLWLRGYTLYILIVHQTHHLGQMTVLMRQAGLKVPGIYGPSKEEWSQWGMQAPKV